MELDLPLHGYRGSDADHHGVAVQQASSDACLSASSCSKVADPKSYIGMYYIVLYSYDHTRSASSPDAISTIMSFLKNGMLEESNSNRPFVRSLPRASASMV